MEWAVTQNHLQARGSASIQTFLGYLKTIGQLEMFRVHIPADHEHQFRFNVNTISGPM